MENREIEYVLEADEPLAFSRRRPRVDAEMDVTPMIDITFLLLFFFLVASRLSDDAFVRLPTARNGTAVAAQTSVIVTVTKGTGSDATIYMGDGAVEETRLRATTMEDQQVELEQYITAGLTLESKRQVLIKAEQGVRHRDVARVARAAGDATAEVLYVAVMEEG